MGDDMGGAMGGGGGDTGSGGSSGGSSPWPMMPKSDHINSMQTARNFGNMLNDKLNRRIKHKRKSSY